MKMNQICGINKTTLLDYPGHIAATIFLGTCNFRCPFCHNGQLVLAPEKEPVVTAEEVIAYLVKRKGILQGVCITGGEPTLHPDLLPFMKEIKDLGYLVKIDTNGYRPEVVKEIIQQRVADYIAMDIKAGIEGYGEAAGVDRIEMTRIQQSIGLIIDSEIQYEFRTTVVKELHTQEDFISIGKMIAGAKRYYLQAFKDSQGVICPGYHGYTKKELEYYANIIRKYVEQVEIRGVDG